MRRLAHLSDLHFGRHDATVVEALSRTLVAERPDLVVISGDFTQRARRDQFRAAGAFLVGLHAAGLRTLSVPGNHDVPLYDVLRRFLDPLSRYRRWIDDDLCPFHSDPEVPVLGINTARSLTFKDGRVSDEQMERIRRCFAGAPDATAPDATKVLVTHHPLVALPWGEDGETLEAAGRASATLQAAIEAGVHLLLAGHHHRPFSGAATAFVAAGDQLLVVQAGTSTSTRTRDHANSFNLLTIDGERLSIEVREWNGGGFVAAGSEHYARVKGRWHPGDSIDCRPAST